MRRREYRRVYGTALWKAPLYRQSGIESRARRGDFGIVPIGPRDEIADGLQQGVPEPRQPVFDGRRHGRKYRPLDKALEL